MSFRLNVAANYTGQIYTTVIGIALVPVHLKWLGSEAYGLVGFFAMLQVWFNLLDMGLTPTIAREAARFHGGALPALEYRRVFRALSVLFAGIGLVGGLALYALAEVFTLNWLNPEQIELADTVTALQIVAVCVSLRWLSGLYRGVISGSERLVWLSGFGAFVATLRFVGVLASMWLWGSTPEVFFWHQFAVAMFEIFVLHAMSQRLLPAHSGLTQAIGWSLRPVQPLLRFALSIALTSSIWVLVTQVDKLLLSGILSLSEFGYFSSAVLVAGGITLMTAPVSGALMPRLTRLHVEQKRAELRQLYSKTTQFVALTAGTAATTMFWCAEPLMFAWTGSREFTENTSDILRLYAVGNGLLAISAFPYYLQYAMGNIRYHLIGNCILGMLLIPTIVVAASQHGATGAGLAWIALNVLYLTIWVPYSHGRLEPGLHGPWLLRDVLAVAAPAQFVGAVTLLIPPEELDRLASFAYTTAFALCCLLISVLSSSHARQRLSALRAGSA